MKHRGCLSLFLGVYNDDEREKEKKKKKKVVLEISKRQDYVLLLYVSPYLSVERKKEIQTAIVHFFQLVSCVLAVSTTPGR